MVDSEEFRARAAHYRDLAVFITDSRARAGIIELARQYERHADEIQTDSTMRMMRPARAAQPGAVRARY
jgi:hypothetical protein